MFAPLSPPERAAGRAQLGLASGDIALLHIGDDPLNAGLDLLLRAAAKLRQAGHPIRLILHDLRGPVEAAEAGRQAAILDADALTDTPLTDTLRTLLVVPGPLTEADQRLLLGAADALISPCRAGAAPMMREAVAMGLPCVWTEGSAPASVQHALDEDEIGWRLPLMPDQPPALDGLFQALQEIAQGRRPDAARFAAARMRLLRAHAPAAFPGPFPGLPPPAVPGAIPQAGPSRPLPPRAPGDPAGLSIVIQGPCVRSGPEPTLDHVLAALRRHFPGAQLIVSTWQGSTTEALDADDIILSPDPGPLIHPGQAHCNINRLMLSTANGLAAATRPHCIKMRSDVVFTGNTLLGYPLERAAAAFSFDRRIWTTGLGTWQLPVYLRPFHMADMVQYGTTEDLRRLWAPHPAAWHDAFLQDPQALLPRACPEQILLTAYLTRIGRPTALDITIDGRPEIIEASLELCLGGFDVCDDAASGIRFPPRLDSVRHIVPPETAAGFAAQRHAFATDRAAMIARTLAAFHLRLHQLLTRTALAQPCSAA